MRSLQLEPGNGFSGWLLEVLGCVKQLSDFFNEKTEGFLPNNAELMIKIYVKHIDKYHIHITSTMSISSDNLDFLGIAFSVGVDQPSPSRPWPQARYIPEAKLAAKRNMQALQN